MSITSNPTSFSLKFSDHIITSSTMLVDMALLTYQPHKKQENLKVVARVRGTHTHPAALPEFALRLTNMRIGSMYGTHKLLSQTRDTMLKFPNAGTNGPPEYEAEFTCELPILEAGDKISCLWSIRSGYLIAKERSLEITQIPSNLCKCTLKTIMLTGCVCGGN